MCVPSLCKQALDISQLARLPQILLWSPSLSRNLLSGVTHVGLDVSLTEGQEVGMSLFYGPVRLPSNHLAGVKSPVTYSLGYIPKRDKGLYQNRGSPIRYHRSQKSHQHIKTAVAEKCRVRKYFHQGLLSTRRSYPRLSTPQPQQKQSPSSQNARVFILVHIQEHRPH